MMSSNRHTFVAANKDINSSEGRGLRLEKRSASSHFYVLGDIIFVAPMVPHGGKSALPHVETL